MTLVDEAAADVERATRQLAAAQAKLASIRSVHIGRLSVTWSAVPSRLDPVRLRVPELQVYDVVQLNHETVVYDAGVRVDQVLQINGFMRITADTRFYSNDFYRSAIAKDLETRPQR